MLNKELVEEVFIEAPHHNAEGRISPLPLAGEFVLLGFKKGWLEAILPVGQAPMVSVGPKTLPNGTEGYSIRKEIVHK